MLPALGAWSGAFLGTAGAWWAAATVLLVTVLAWVVLVRLVGRTTGLAALAALALLAGGVAVGGIARASVTTGPLPGLAAAGATVDGPGGAHG